MAITKTIKPYEFLARWCEKTGELKGYHFMNIEVVADGGQILAATPLPAMNVSAAAAAGFPMEAILDAQTIAALQSVEIAQAEKEAAIAARDALAAEKSQVEAEMATLLNDAVAAKNAAQAQLLTAQQRITELEGEGA